MLCHAATYVMDNPSRIILGVDAGKPDKKTESTLTLQQIRGIRWYHHRGAVVFAMGYVLSAMVIAAHYIVLCALQRVRELHGHTLEGLCRGVVFQQAVRT
jgi:hypothetical protein